MILCQVLGTLPGSMCSINGSCPISGSILLLLLLLPWLLLAEHPSKLSLQFPAVAQVVSWPHT